MKILHIEDKDIITEPIGVFLRFSGYEYESTTDGKKGLELIRANQYDVVLLDLYMPEFSGFDVIDGLVRDGSIKNQKIVILSAATLSPEQMKEFREKGVHSSLGKPIQNDVLLEKLKLIETDHSISTNVS